MCRDHDPLHALLAAWLGLEASYGMLDAASGFTRPTPRRPQPRRRRCCALCCEHHPVWLIALRSTMTGVLSIVILTSPPS
jgi:hypothetical protein